MWHWLWEEKLSLTTKWNERRLYKKNKEQIMGFSNYMDEFDQGILKRELVQGYEEKMKEIVANMKSTKK